ncbi:hypothetical protein CPB85DRAFT_283394 [Mucidula mucida]|nr:hypothetical protein CPB85DRAFT_283394 [Mucidula mucida]
MMIRQDSSSFAIYSQPLSYDEQYDEQRRKLAAASENYLELAQTAAYGDLIGPYVDLWLNANNTDYDDLVAGVIWPHGHPSNAKAVWDILFDGIPIDLWHKPALLYEKVRYWRHIKEMLLLLKVEIPYLARQKKWMETVISLNSCRPASSDTVFLPRGGTRLYPVSAVRRWWKEVFEDTEGQLQRDNVVLALQKRVDDFDWYPMNCGALLKGESTFEIISLYSTDIYILSNVEDTPGQDVSRVL